MIDYIFGTSIVKCINIYCKKHLISSLEPHEFMYMNTFLISVILLIYFLYTMITNKTNYNILYEKYTSLSNNQLISAVMFSLITVITTYSIISIDKNYGNNYTNSLLLKAFTTIIILVIGIYIFQEEYSNYKIFGVFLLLTGIYFISD